MGKKCTEKGFWSERGVSKEVRDARPYRYWDEKDRSAVRKGYEGLDGGAVEWLLSKARESKTGLVIQRFAPDDTYDRPYPEIRPDDEVTTRHVKHYHGWTPCPDKHVHAGMSKKQLKRHLKKEHRDASPEELAKAMTVPHKYEMPYKWFLRSARQMEAHRKKYHSEGLHPGDIGNDETIHQHTIKAKYLFPPNPKDEFTYEHCHGPELYEHTHEDMDEGRLQRHLRADHGGAEKWTRGNALHKHAGHLRDDDDIERHIKNHHKGELPCMLAAAWNEPHEHTDKRKSRDINYAERLDMHPWAKARLEKARLVYFGIEGCIKADSILTAILREDRPETVFSVPSVSLWKAPELPHFIKNYLRGKIVVIVPDADWFTNRNVIAQARFCQTYLRSYGLRNVHVAAPPVVNGKVEHKGVDDYLGEGKGSLDELDVIERIIPYDRLREFASEYAEGDVVVGIRTAAALNAVAAHSDRNGALSARYATIGRIMSGHRIDSQNMGNRAKDALSDLKRWGAITITGDLETTEDPYIPTGGGSGYCAHGEEWEDPPTFTLNWRAGLYAQDICVKLKNLDELEQMVNTAEREEFEADLARAYAKVCRERFATPRLDLAS